MISKRLCSLIVTCSLAVSLVSGGGVPVRESTARERKDNYIIMTENQDNIQEMKEKCEEEYQAEVAETCSAQGDNYSENYMVCKLSDSDAEELAGSEDVIVEKDGIIRACAVDTDGEEDADAEWNIQMVRAEEGEKTETGDKKIKVAVLDSGVDDFNDLQLADSIDLIPGEEEVLPLFWDVTGHGSSVAGIIAAEKNDVGITGIAPNTEIYAAKVLDEKNQAPVSRVIDGIYWAIEKKVNIINMSFGIKTDSAALHKAIRDAYDAGILLVAAAGNGNDVEYPAAYDEVIAVGSVDTSGSVSEKSASGDELELVAPGEQICSTGAFEGTLICAGTSMAAPHVTGIAAKLWAKDTSVSAEFIRQLMAASANDCGEKDSYGNGLVDLAYAEEIYDTFKENYTSKNNLLENIEGNNAPIETYDDVEYVEGRWYGGDHENAISNSNLNSSQISILKTGAIYADKKDSCYYGMHDNPEWHGYYTINYISAYIYITRIAVALGKGKDASDAVAPSGISTLKSSNIISDVNTLPFKTILQTPNAANKKIFVWGMAIHSAMDVFAHSSYGRINGVWKFLNHSKTNPVVGIADDTSLDGFPERYQTAVKVAKKSLDTYINGTTGNVSDFLPANSYKSAGITWAIRNLYEYANVFSSSVANALQPYSGRGEGD